MRNRHSYLVLLLLTLVLAACGGQTAGDVSGTWNGQITFSDGPLPIVMTLTQTGTSVSGTLTLAGGQAPINGTAANNIVSLTAQGSGGSFLFNGSVSGGTMQGTVTIALNDGTSGTADFSVTKQ